MTLAELSLKRPVTATMFFVSMTVIGLLAELCTALARANIPVFVISTYDTDWLLITAENLDATRKALGAIGYVVEGEAPAQRER